MKGRAIPYSEAELRWIEGHRDWPRRQMHAAFVARFGRSDVSLPSLCGLCKRNGWMTGRDGRYEKGREPENKGKRMSWNANSAAHQFKKGSQSGRARQLYQPIGTERFGKSGYLERKINDDLPMQRRWRAVHIIRWEAEHGPTPAGHALKCLDGDRLNTDPANWTAIPRALLPRLAGKSGRDYDNAPAELKPVILATARLAQRASDARKRDADERKTHG